MKRKKSPKLKDCLIINVIKVFGYLNTGVHYVQL